MSQSRKQGPVLEKKCIVDVLATRKPQKDYCRSFLAGSSLDHGSLITRSSYQLTPSETTIFTTPNHCDPLLVPCLVP